MKQVSYVAPGVRRAYKARIEALVIQAQGLGFRVKRLGSTSFGA